jgi:hypothetical protein
LRQAQGDLEKAWLVVDWPAGDPEPYHYYLTCRIFTGPRPKHRKLNFLPWGDIST